MPRCATRYWRWAMADKNDSDQRTIKLDKELIVFIPVFGSALAIVFDVGYFSGIDINLFTLFSINEHIVFALQVFPTTLLCSLLFYLATSSFDSARSRYQKF